MISRQDKAVVLALTWLQEQDHGTAAQLKSAITNTCEDNSVLLVTISFKAEGEYVFFDLSVAQNDVVTLIKAY